MNYAKSIGLFIIAVLQFGCHSPTPKQAATTASSLPTAPTLVVPDRTSEAIEVLLIRARANRRMNTEESRIMAITDYVTVLRLDPENSQAQLHLDYLRGPHVKKDLVDRTEDWNMQIRWTTEWLKRFNYE